MKPSGIITFLSDFGLDDWYVAAVKGEILKINDRAVIIDVTHAIRPHDIRGAAFALWQHYHSFPPGTVHLAVVDPGVGSVRRAIAMCANGHCFVGPDNGVFSYVAGSEAVVYDIPVPDTASSTFHGRDVFAPVAARLSLGEELGFDEIPVEQCRQYTFPGCTVKKDSIEGEIVYVDHFGNCITNIPTAYKARVLVLNRAVIPVIACYEGGTGGTLVAVKGSSGFYEIAVDQGRASEIGRIGCGTRVTAQP